MSIKALEALRLYDIWQATPTDRGGHTGPKGLAYVAFEEAKTAALVEATEIEARFATIRDEQARIERMARMIYEQWSDEPRYVPWVEGGNSDKQNEARQIARDWPPI